MGFPAGAGKGCRKGGSMTVMARRIVAIVTAAGILAAIFEAHCLLSASRHLERGNRAAAAGRPDLARLEWESAAARPAPFNAFAREAMARLVAEEERLEGEGRTAEALRLCFSIRGIAASTEGYLSYYDRERSAVMDRMPKLSAALGVELSPDRYTPYRPVRTFAAHLAIMCFAGFALSGVLAIRAEGGKSRILRGVLSAALFVLWILFLRVS